MHTLEQFLAGGDSLNVYRGEEMIFSSESSDLKPLIDFIDSAEEMSGELTFFDKYVGRAAGLLMALVKPCMVYAGVISEGGAETLEKYDIPFEAGRRVKYLMGVASGDMCQWEKLSLGKDPQQLWDLLKNMDNGAQQK